MVELEEADMLGNGTQGDSGQIAALGGDAIDELLGRIKERTLGVDSGGGNKGGGGNGSGDGNDDPLKGVPVDARMLIDALKQMADFAKSIVLMATDKQTDLTMDVAELAKRTAELVGRDVLEAVKTEAEARRSLTPILVRRFEAIEHTLLEIQTHLGAVYEGDEKRTAEDEGSGP